MALTHTHSLPACLCKPGTCCNAFHSAVKCEGRKGAVQNYAREGVRKGGGDLQYVVQTAHSQISGF